ncbi:Zinc finger protein 131 [Frankliniella fusca]|uniref:Zinc finger protein 131 n=1 Tax=Frankliniella fusca TaxID=407009 RepID=A0AAE1HV90_9NEOP|nr:Zinc finger protein 131 [Frankliniella fusca]KAK3928089.1 Zinc finger protein 131 [Frankliniella fusca]
MDSLSSIESGTCSQDPNKTPTKVPLFQSTLKSKRAFICQYCGKQYIVGHYYRVHVEKHLSDAASANVSQVVAVNDSAISIIDNDTSVRNGGFLVPQAAVRKKPKKTVIGKVKLKPKYICTYCLKGYLDQRAFKQHVRNHAIQDAAARFPDKEKILNQVDNISDAALNKTANAPCYGEGGQRFKELIGYIISIVSSDKWKNFSTEVCEELVSEIVKKKFVLPSAMSTLLLRDCENLLSNTSLCRSLLDLLEIPKDLEMNNLPAGHTLQLKAPIVLDNDDKQVIYYCGGSILWGYVRMSYRYGNSSSLKKIVEVVKSKILRDKPTAEDDGDAAWTIARDRGGLLYLTSECKEFFIDLTEVVFAAEESDGSIDYESVLTKVTNCNISFKWDNIIGDALDPRNSIELINDVVRYYCRTRMSGFMRKRINYLKSKPVISMPIRHAVARRKKSNPIM